VLQECKQNRCCCKKCPSERRRTHRDRGPGLPSSPRAAAAVRHHSTYIGPPNGPIQRPKPVSYAQYECYEATARSETRNTKIGPCDAVCDPRPARCPAWGLGTGDWGTRPWKWQNWAPSTRNAQMLMQGDRWPILLILRCSLLATRYSYYYYSSGGKK
jgi:hypothetical protein